MSKGPVSFNVNEDAVELLVGGQVVHPAATVTLSAQELTTLVVDYVKAATETGARHARKTDHRRKTILRDKDGRIVGLEDEIVQPAASRPATPAAKQIGFRPPGAKAGV